MYERVLLLNLLGIRMMIVVEDVAAEQMKCIVL